MRLRSAPNLLPEIVEVQLPIEAGCLYLAVFPQLLEVSLEAVLSIILCQTELSTDQSSDLQLRHYINQHIHRI